MLNREVKRRMYLYGPCEVRASQSTITIDPRTDTFDIEGAYDEVKKIFGLVGVSRALKVEKDMDAIAEAIRAWAPTQLSQYKTFKVEGKRSDKRFPLDSIQLAREIGGVGYAVDVEETQLFHGGAGKGGVAADGSEGVASLVVPFVCVGHFPDAEAVEDDEKYAVGHGGSFLIYG